MIANIPANIEAQYETESAMLSDAFWAAKHAAKITYAEWRAAEKVTCAEARLARRSKSAAPGHRHKLVRLFGTADLMHLRKSHGDHPAVLAAIRAAHKRAGITPKDLQGYERVERIIQADDAAPAPHGDTLCRTFGASSYVGAYRAFAAKWDGYFEGLYVATA